MAPNIANRMMVWLPILAEPPLYTAGDVPRLTLDQILDANEALTLRNEMARRSAAKRAEADKKPRRR